MSGGEEVRGISQRKEVVKQADIAMHYCKKEMSSKQRQKKIFTLQGLSVYDVAHILHGRKAEPTTQFH